MISSSPIPSSAQELEPETEAALKDDDNGAPFLVTFEEADPDFPHNWPLLKKAWVTAVLALFNLIGTVASSIFGTAQEEVMREFGVGHLVAVLGTTAYMVGYIFGFLTFGPLSERFGRKWPLLTGVIISSLFSLMPALSRDISVVLLGRFFAGLFGVAPVAVLGGVISDCWAMAHRGIAMAAAVCVVFSGPTFGPVVGGLIVGSERLDWRWTMWVVIIAGLGLAAVSVVLYPETYPPAILRRKARGSRRKYGNPDIRTESDEEGYTLREISRVYLFRPFWLISTQPILALLTLYQSFLYGVLFLFYQSYPIAFGSDRNWSITLRTLPLLAIIVGTVAGTIGLIIYNQLYFRHHCHTPSGTFIPESRLPPMILGGILIPIGMFWYAWTSAPSVPWPSPVCASLLIGCGIYLVFIQGWAYIVDCYTSMANSAMGVNGSMRSVFGATFPLFAAQMVRGLGVARATSVLGAVSVALVPVPVCFWYWGHKIRTWSTAKLTDGDF